MVSIMRINGMGISTNDINYNCHIKAVELVELIWIISYYKLYHVTIVINSHRGGLSHICKPTKQLYKKPGECRPMLVCYAGALCQHTAGLTRNIM